jgi:hypothetical protein
MGTSQYRRCFGVPFNGLCIIRVLLWLPRRVNLRAYLGIVTPHCPIGNHKIKLVKEELDIVPARIES